MRRTLRKSEDNRDGKTVVYLDQTVFYPPRRQYRDYDTGTISSGRHKEFVVEEVRNAEGEVLHIGRFQHVRFMEGEPGEMRLDAEQRLLTCLHSAGARARYDGQ